MFEFQIVARDPTSRARAGRFQTPHGIVETPTFMPVGTLATVKTLDPRELRQVGSQMVLANTYHLAQRPGADVVERLGGLHRFMAWDGPILTDSGGFQVWSLGTGEAKRKLVRIDEEGATFVSHRDGRRWRFTPESAIDLQIRLGADVIMAFDECTARNVGEDAARAAAARTHRWAARCRERWWQRQGEGRLPQALFGIIQGGSFRDLRRWSAETIAALDLPGIAIGGEAIGYSKNDTAQILDWLADVLPVERPRYAMGVGDPVDFLTVVERGVDLFDSVYPTRLARNGGLLVPGGRLRITAPRFRADEGPITAGCRCLTCQCFSRAYLHHLFRARELLAYRLATLHNLTYCLDLTAAMRQALQEGRFAEFRSRAELPPFRGGDSG
ncbi:MAG TPA: tRNA guanosine(34) transglycosylase Tgt [Chloroflexota bacterium]|nr:tRNA guanosine(34) transglycosylase Tgt [Chloroflexota bacterium]